MTGVSNLRAMFEQNKGPAEDDRGRSPGGGSLGGASAGTSPRPLSKVRTNFVTVERNGQIGFQRDLSRESSTSKLETSVNLGDETPKDLPETTQVTRPDVEGRKRSSLAEEITLKSPIDKTQPKEKNMEGRSGTAKSAASKSDDKAAGAQTNGGTKQSVTKPVEKPTVAKNKTSSKPVPISIAKPSAPSKAPPKPHLKSPAPPKTPTTPNRSQVKDAPAKVQEKKTAKAALAPEDASKPTRKHTATAATEPAQKTRIKESPPQTGFKKPRPKSPTRPVKLPASLTAHTASSGSKSNASPPQIRQTLSRASGNAQAMNSGQAHHTASRSPSRASTNINKSSLSRKSSTLKQGSGRPSFGPPPSQLKKQPSRGSLPHQPAPADDSFLARMMRPTTASASKTAEKPATTTPPKGEPSVGRPVTREGPSKPDGSSKGSPAPKPRQPAPAKVSTKPTKPVEKALRTPNSAGTVATKNTPSKERKAVKNTPGLQKDRKVPAVEDTPVVEDTIEPNPAEPSPVSDPAVEEVKIAQPEASEPSLEETKKEASPVVEAKKESSPIAQAKEESCIPDTIKEEPVTELKPAQVKESTESIEAKEESVADLKPAQVEETVASVETKEKAPKPQEPEAVEQNKEMPIPKAVEDEPAQENVAPAAQQTPIVEEPEKITPVKIESPLPTPSRFAFDEEEDEEDAKARAEIEKLNAEFARIASEGKSK